MSLPKIVLERCLNCRNLKVRHGTLVCKLGRTPESCRRMKRRSKSQSGKKLGREVVIRGDGKED